MNFLLPCYQLPAKQVILEEHVHNVRLKPAWICRLLMRLRNISAGRTLCACVG